MRTGGLTLLFVRTILKLVGSVETELHSILLSLLRSRVERSAGEVTWRATVEATRARTADVERVNCIVGLLSGFLQLRKVIESPLGIRRRS